MRLQPAEASSRRVGVRFIPAAAIAGSIVTPRRRLPRLTAAFATLAAAIERMSWLQGRAR